MGCANRGGAHVTRPRAVACHVFAGGFSLGVRSRFDVGVHLEASDYGAATCRRNFPGVDVRISPTGAWPVADLVGVDLVFANPPCFVPGTMVTTRRGRVPVEDVAVGDVVLTHTGSWQSVEQVFKRAYRGVTVELDIMYRPDAVRCTPEHPLFVCRLINRRPRTYDEPTWIRADDVRVGDAVLAPSAAVINKPPALVVKWKHGVRAGRNSAKRCEIVERPNNVDINSEHVAWMFGAYLANGYRRGCEATLEHTWLTPRSVLIAVGQPKVDELTKRIAACGKRPTIDRLDQSAAVLSINSMDWWQVCAEFGDGATAKRLPEWVFGMPQAWRRALIDGYVYGDGCTRVVGKCTVVNVGTSSEELARGVTRLVETTLGVPCSLRRGRGPGVDVICGRTVNRHQQWKVCWFFPARYKRMGEVDARGTWLPVKTVKKAAGVRTSVHNLEVACDNSYVANGIAAHNCAPWSAAGARGGTARRDFTHGFDPRDKRVSMFFQAHGLLARIRPRILVIESVPRSWSCGRPFVDPLIKQAQALGYGCDVVFHDAYDCGAPQHRKRVIYVFTNVALPWLKPCVPGPRTVGEALASSGSALLGPERYLNAEEAAAAVARAPTGTMPSLMRRTSVPCGSPSEHGRG